MKNEMLFFNTLSLIFITLCIALGVWFGFIFGVNAGLEQSKRLTEAKLIIHYTDGLNKTNDIVISIPTKRE